MCLRSAEAKHRFTEEAHPTSAIDHMNFCTVHDIDDKPHEHVLIVMDYYEGEMIEENISLGPLEVVEAMDLADQTPRRLSRQEVKAVLILLGWWACQH